MVLNTTITHAESQAKLLPEWAEQAAVMLVWPHAESDWAAILEQAWHCYRDIAKAILEHEDLVIVARDSAHQQSVLAYLQHCKRQPFFVLHPTNDTWIRDYGPLSVQAGNTQRLIDFRFNAWGGKYPYAKDDTLAESLRLSQRFAPISRVNLVLEGGAVETDGRGTFMATRSSVISTSRNGVLSQSDMESFLQTTLGIQHCHWLDCAGLAGDDTDGHIDTLARFLDEQTILYATVAEEHPDFAALKAFEEQLLRLRDPDGQPYHCIPLPAPPLRYSVLDQRLLAATYANFLIINNAVLLPVYDDPQDQLAIDRLTAATKRQIIPINCNALIEQNGSLHCATMQLAQNTYFPETA